MRLPKDFMRLQKDLLSGIYKKPNIYLCETDKLKICKLETFNTKGSFKFNSLSELSFEIPRIYMDVITGEQEVHPYYEKIEAPRLILLEGFGYFEMQTVELTSDGIDEHKSITANSLEYVLSTKYLENFYINTGETQSVEVIYSEANGTRLIPVSLYNPNNTKLSLLHLVLEEIYGWKIGHVDSSLCTLTRQFEVDRESVYDFLMNEVCEKFNCYIVFDTINNTINLYAESLTAKFIGDGSTKTFTISPPFAKIGTVSVDGYKTTRWTYNSTNGLLTLEDVPPADARIEVVDGALTEWETDILVSFDNLIQEANVDYSMDDIKTKLTVTYGDDLDIREANLGLPYLTDISYYYHPDWMGQDLYDAYGLYMQKCNSAQTKYTKNSQEILKWNDYIAYENGRLSLEYSVVTNVNSTTVGSYYIRRENLDGSYYYSEVSLPSDYNAEETYYSNLTTNVNNTKVSDLYTALKQYFYAYFTGDATKKTEALNSIKELKGFEFMKTYTITYLYDGLKNATNQDSMDAVVNNFLGEIWNELGKTPLEQLYLIPYKNIQETNIEAGWSVLTDSNYGNYYPVVLMIATIESAIKNCDVKIAEYKKNQEPYHTENSTIASSLLMRNNFTEAQLIRLSAFLREDELHLDDIVETNLTDTADSFKIKQDAMESGRIELQKICQPRLQFSMTMANIYALPEFEPIVHQFQLGNVIRVRLRSGYNKQSRLLAVDINFDDFSDFSCEFGELTEPQTQSDIHADLLSNAISAGKSVAANSSYWTRGSDVATATDSKIQQGLLDATTQIKAMDGSQGVVIDKYGIKLQKNNADGSIDPKQTWITNNMILMSDDGFKTSKAGLGEFKVNNESRYGLMADAVLAGYVEGSEIVGGTISSTNYKSGESGTHFDLVNGDFEIAGGNIVYDTTGDTLTLRNVTIEWETSNSPEVVVKDVSGLDEALGDIEDQLDVLDSAIGGTTKIGSNYVISPYIAGGYLNIKNANNNSRVIIDPNNLTGNNYVFQVHNGNKVTMGVDTSGNAVFNGAVTATSLTLASDIKIGTGNISGLSSVAISGSYSDLSNKPTIPTSVKDLGLDTSTIIYKGDITQTTKTDKDGISYVETIVPSSNGNITYSTYDANNYIVFGRSQGTNIAGNNYVCISKDGLLTARNALIYGTVYATDGEFSGKIIGGSININNQFNVDTSGNITMNSNSSLTVNSGGVVKINADSESSSITLGEYFAISNGGLTAKTGNFTETLKVKGKDVLTTESLGIASNIVVSREKPSGNGIIWMCPIDTNGKVIEYSCETGYSRVNFGPSSNYTRTYTLSNVDTSTMANSTFKYTIRFPVYLTYDGSKINSADFTITAYKSNNSSNSIEFKTTMGTLNAWYEEYIEATITSSVNLFSDATPITVSIHCAATGTDVTNLCIQKDSHIKLTAVDTNAAGSVQTCSVHYIV